MKENVYQIIGNELDKLPKWRTHEISNRLFWGLDVVAETDDEIYVSITIGKYKITVFCIVPKKVVLLKYWKWASHLKSCYHYAKVVENAR